MRLMLKYIKENIKSEKLLSASVVLIVTICCAVIISSLSLINGMVNLLNDQVSAEVGNTDIKVMTKERSDPLLYKEKLDSIKGIDYSVGFINQKVIYEDDANNVLFDIDAIGSDDLKILGYYKPLEGRTLNDFIGDKIIIGENVAEKYGLSVGDELPFLINGEEKDLTVYAINKNYAKFKTSGFNEYGIVPFEVLGYAGEDSVNHILIKIDKTDEVEAVVEKIKEIYPGTFVNQAVSGAEMDRDVNSAKMSFNLIIIVMMLMSIYIIYTISKVLIFNRMATIGTLRSLGASKNLMKRFIIVEYILYGFLGSILGIALGRLIFNMLNQMVFQNTPIDFSITIEQIGIGFLVSFGISIISSYLAITKIVNQSIRELVTEKITQSEKKYLLRTIASIVMLVLSWLITFFPANMEGISEMMGMCSLLFALIGILLIMPMLSKILNRFLVVVLEPIFKNEGIIALLNLKSDAYANKSITLLALTIAGLLLVGNIGFSIVNATQSFFDDNVSFDIWMTAKSLNDETVDEIKNMDGVQKAIGSVEYYDAEAIGKNFDIARVLGVDQDKEILNYLDLNIENEKNIDKILSGRNIMVSEFLKSKLGLEVNDTIELKIEDDIHSYQIIGFFDSVLDGGDVVLCSSEQLLKDLSKKDFKYIYIQVSEGTNRDIIAQKLKDEYDDLTPTILTTEELSLQQSSNSDMLINIFKIFIVICGVTCALGVLTNTITSIVSRTRAISIKISIGMNHSQVVKMMFVEALVCSILACIGAGAGTLLVVKVMPYFFSTVSAPNLTVYFPTKYFIICGLLGGIITIFSSILQVNRIKKFNIVEIIRN